MSGGGVLARRYAKALFSLGQERVGAETILREVDELVDAARSTPQSQRALFTPLHPRAERRALIRALADRLGVSPEVRAFGMLLVDENRMLLLSAIRDALRELVDRSAGRVQAIVKTARPLSDAQRARLEQVLSRRTRTQVQLAVEVDPDLIGGIVVRVGDLLLDGSLRTQLNSLAGSLRKGPA
jgi:F-type H+-transporting ATPase subunit delta